MNRYQKEVAKITDRFLQLSSSKKNYRKARIEMRKQTNLYHSRYGSFTAKYNAYMRDKARLEAYPEGSIYYIKDKGRWDIK